MVLDMLSRRTERVVRYVNVLDFIGMGFGHRKIMGYAKEFNAGNAGLAVPQGLCAASYLVGVNTIAAGLFNTVKMAFLNEDQKRKTHVISGDPFRHSRDFAERFDRATMPVDVGGELSAGDDGHCCVGVAHTALTDAGAILEQHNAFDDMIGEVAFPTKTATMTTTTRGSFCDTNDAKADITVVPPTTALLDAPEDHHDPVKTLLAMVARVKLDATFVAMLKQEKGDIGRVEKRFTDAVRAMLAGLESEVSDAMEQDAPAAVAKEPVAAAEGGGAPVASER